MGKLLVEASGCASRRTCCKSRLRRAAVFLGDLLDCVCFMLNYKVIQSRSSWRRRGLFSGLFLPSGSILTITVVKETVSVPVAGWKTACLFVALHLCCWSALKAPETPVELLQKKNRNQRNLLSSLKAETLAVGCICSSWDTRQLGQAEPQGAAAAVNQQHKYTKWYTTGQTAAQRESELTHITAADSSALLLGFSLFSESLNNSTPPEKSNLCLLLVVKIH